jgi:hypothetical protein
MGPEDRIGVLRPQGLRPGAIEVGLTRIELVTSALSVLRSNQLSYSPVPGQTQFFGPATRLRPTVALITDALGHGDENHTIQGTRDSAGTEFGALGTPGRHRAGRDPVSGKPHQTIRTVKAPRRRPAGRWHSGTVALKSAGQFAAQRALRTLYPIDLRRQEMPDHGIHPRRQRKQDRRRARSMQQCPHARRGLSRSLGKLLEE